MLIKIASFVLENKKVFKCDFDKYMVLLGDLSVDKDEYLARKAKLIMDRQ